MPPRKPVPRSRTRAATPKAAEHLARALAAEILGGGRPVGAVLPSEADLAARQGIPLAAARRAMRLLEAMGLAARSRGGPARVISGEIRATYVVTDDASDYAGPTTVALDRQRTVIADAELAVLLGVNEGTRWLQLTGLRQPMDPEFGPLSWVDVWLAGDNVVVPEDASFDLAGIEALSRGSIAGIQEDVSAGLLTPAQARLLRARGGTAALHLLRRFLRTGGTVVAAVRDVHPAERITVSLRGRRRG